MTDDDVVPAHAKPIIMRPWSIVRIIAGLKDETRRLIKPQPVEAGVSFGGEPQYRFESPRYDNGDGVHYFHTGRHAAERLLIDKVSRYKNDDVLWVKERVNVAGVPCQDRSATTCVVYPATREVRHYDPDNPKADSTGHVWWTYESDDPRLAALRWRSPLYCPRIAGRLVLRVEFVRVERVQEITPTNEAREGCAGERYATLWDEINRKRGARWADNPWVFVYRFHPIAGHEPERKRQALALLNEQWKAAGK